MAELGTFTAPGERYGGLNQDAAATARVDLGGGGEACIAVVADGHGICGERAAAAACAAIADALLAPGAAAEACAGQAEADAAAAFPARLERFYRAHNSAKLEEVPALAEKYRGKEEAFMEAAVGKYGAEPEGHAGEPWGDLLRAAFAAGHEAALRAASDDLPEQCDYLGRSYRLCRDDPGWLQWEAPQGRVLAECGATAAAAVAVLRPGGLGGELWAAHCGDSGVALCRESGGGCKGQLLTPPHDARQPQERERIAAAPGARLSGAEGGPAPRVELAEGPFGGRQAVAVTRALGHRHMTAERCGLVPVPEVSRTVLRGEHCAVLVWSDGVSDGLPRPGQQARAALEDGAAAAGAESAARALVEAALAGAPSPADNTTACVMLLPAEAG
eukprot:TRINITY_DN43192_c0_g1_i2.p2 TRINITY_DN43192_c0_g1~~TRINITY_DN43192_c0_g1_i2.p2  ORF type:complete len:414 (+),score=143.92 TRINITY_DN43192_c0_g1_i2:76-1242(+)